MEITERLLYAMEEAGADLIEIGIPFSDPTAEGVVIQKANERALEAGCTTDKLFDTIKRARKKVRVPMVFLTYVNPIYTYGKERFMKRCVECGIDGLIVPDMPFEEKGELAPVCADYGVEIISLIAPTSKERIQKIAEGAQGYIYCVSSLGVTGVRSEITSDIAGMVKLVRQVADTPCAVGFGISTPQQAKEMAEEGVKELILVAQETTVYGTDIYGKKSLHILLKELCKIKGIRWIRVLYCYPEEIYDELIQTMKEEKKICHYLDLPIQHASDRILKRMGRRTTQAELVEIVNKLRREIPDIVLRTTLISGFPGETQEDHEELMGFVDEMEFDRLGVFTYSPEEDTPAATMPDQVAEEVKEARRDEIMELQQEISYDKGTDRIGQELLVMIEGKVADESAYIGRTYGDAPKVDGYIFVQTGELLMTGDFAKVRVTGALEYDLIGELADEYTE